MPKLTGTGRIADDLYLLAHDDVTGKPFLQPRALGAGLAGGLLAELTFAGVLCVQAERLDLTYRGRPADDLGRHVRGLLVAESGRYPVRDWLLFLGATAEENVARRLEQAGYVTEVSSRLPWRGNRWVPADSDCAFAPLIRVKAAMEQSRPVTVSDIVLTGLATACGLGARILPFGPADARRHVEMAIRKLPPGLRDLITQTQAAVDSGLLSYRV